MFMLFKKKKKKKRINSRATSYTKVHYTEQATCSPTDSLLEAL